MLDRRRPGAVEGVPGREAIVAALARSALRSDVVRRAAARPHWREVYLGCPLGEGVLEGFVDLLYADGLVAAGADLDAKVDRYKVQLAAYAYAVGQVVGEPMVRAVLLFLGPSGAVEREVDVLSVDIHALARELT
ncbi:MAG: hypothetical protein M3159_05650 [Actinomycetota bacterium]|nr:hypothetical protein [Actinomycetota bacterium]